jgi:hypothetical protein
VIKAIVYSDISDKKNPQDSATLSREDCLARTLDLIDFNAALSRNRVSEKDICNANQVEWIELTLLKKW